LLRPAFAKAAKQEIFMRFTIGSRALTQASAYNPTTLVVITWYNPNVFDSHGRPTWLQLRRFDGQPFGITSSLRDGTLECNRHRQVWAEESHVTVLPDLCELPEYVPQPVVDLWEAGNAARARAAQVTATEASYFVGAPS